MQLFTDPVFLVELVMLSSLLAMGLHVSYTDCRWRQIPNRVTFALLGLGLLGQGLMVALEVTVPSRVVAVVLTALGLAVVLVLLGFWAPGDAKLFWAAAVALPPSLCPSRDPFSLQAAPLALLFNALLVYLVLLLLAPLWRREWGRHPRHEQDLDRPTGPQWLQAGLGLAGLLGLILSFAMVVVGGPLTYLEGFAALVLGYRLLERGLVVRYWPVVVLPGLVALVYLGQASSAWKGYLLFWGAAWLAELAYLQIRFWYGRAFALAVPMAQLQAGMLLRQPLQVRSTAGEQLNCPVGVPLSEQQVHRLRDLARRGLLPEGESLETEQSLPFAPVIVVAAALTAAFSGNLVLPLRWLLGWVRG